MKKVLLVTHVSGFVPQFEMNNVRILQEMGYEVHYASNFNNVSYGNDNSRLEGTGIVCHQVDFARSPFDIKANSRAYIQLKRIMDEHDFEIIHCHTPVGATYGRWAARKQRKRGTKVIYTAHGFHFYKNAPLKFWLVSYPMERFLTHFTDILITINEEDYQSAKKMPRAKSQKTTMEVYKIDSAGIDLEKYNPNAENFFEIKKRIRKEFDIEEDTFVLVSVGELNWNKNHSVVVNALGQIEELKIQYIICGQGIEKETLKMQAENLGIGKQVILTGFRKDIPDILKAADAMAFPSLREGLGMVAIEAMASEIPVIALDNRGTREYMKDGINGYIVWNNNDIEMAEAIQKLYHLWKDDKGDYKKMQKNCLRTAQRFGSANVNQQMKLIYEKACGQVREETK